MSMSFPHHVNMQIYSTWNFSTCSASFLSDKFDMEINVLWVDLEMIFLVLKRVWKLIWRALRQFLIFMSAYIYVRIFTKKSSWMLNEEFSHIKHWIKKMVNGSSFHALKMLSWSSTVLHSLLHIFFIYIYMLLSHSHSSSWKNYSNVKTHLSMKWKKHVASMHAID